MFRFEIGDPVFLVGKMRGMDQMRGDIFHIARRIKDYAGNTVYTFQEDHIAAVYDEDWLAPAAQKEVDTSELDSFFNEF